jgi:hypothetical protein
MTSYLFPSRLNEAFTRLHINPQSVHHVLHPSANFINISRLLKWKSQTRGRVSIFSDHSDEMSRRRDCSVTRVSMTSRSPG